MRLSRILRKEFFITLFWKQNKHHKHGVLVHTLAVMYYVAKRGHYRMLPAALLHDIAKPVIAFQDSNDVKTGQYSFWNHEELSYQIIKHWPLSSYTKSLVRYHYLLRGMQKAVQRDQIKKYKRLERIYHRLDAPFKKELDYFLACDDQGKG